MSAELVSPTDPETGLPLLLAPLCNELPKDNPDIADEHHPWHPRAEIIGTVAGVALRNSFIQLAERQLHNDGPLAYHNFYKGPELPETRSAIFARCIVACAGYIPSSVIDTSSGEPIERSATKQELAFLKTPSAHDEFGYKYVRYGYDPLKKFFREYTFERGTLELDEARIDRFLGSKKPRAKRKLGVQLIDESVQIAGSEVDNLYGALRRSKAIHPRMPDVAHKLLGYKLGREALRPLLVFEFERWLNTSQASDSCN